MSAAIDVAVDIIDIDEPGEVEVRWRQPEVGTQLPAVLSDPDSANNDNPGTEAVETGIAGPDGTGDPAYQWYRAKVDEPNEDLTLSEVMNLGTTTSEWEAIQAENGDAQEGSNTRIYTPQAADVGKKLLVRATYTDTRAPGDEAADTNPTEYAYGISEFAVQADVEDDDNNSPDFRGARDNKDDSGEHSHRGPRGRVVMVQNNEDNDVLTYELVQTLTDGDGITEDPVLTYGDPGNPDVDEEDVTGFNIDKDSGQIRVAKRLSAEESGDFREYTSTEANFVAPTPGEYVLVVRATDPSGEGLVDGANENENRDDIVVTVTVTDVNEAPGVMGKAELWVNEADSSNKKLLPRSGIQVGP